MIPSVKHKMKNINCTKHKNAIYLTRKLCNHSYKLKLHMWVNFQLYSQRERERERERENLLPPLFHCSGPFLICFFNSRNTIKHKTFFSGLLIKGNQSEASCPTMNHDKGISKLSYVSVTYIRPIFLTILDFELPEV
jgi:hypothetical protein